MILTFQTHSNLDYFKDLVLETKKIMSFILSKFKKPYIAYSGGKDSSVLVHLLMQLNPHITIIHWDYGPYLIPRTIESKIIDNALKMNVKHFRYMTSPLYEKLKRNLNNVWGKEFMDKYIFSLAEEGFDCSFIGLRAEESHMRKAKTQDLLSHDDAMINAYPLRDWTWKDIFAYLLKYDVPYLKVHYDKYGGLLGYNKVRFVTFFDPDFKHLGSDNIDGILMPEFKNIK